jgi:hypothetical protein
VSQNRLWGSWRVGLTGEMYPTATIMPDLHCAVFAFAAVLVCANIALCMPPHPHPEPLTWMHAGTWRKTRLPHPDRPRKNVQLQNRTCLQNSHAATQKPPHPHKERKRSKSPSYRRIGVFREQQNNQSSTVLHSNTAKTRGVC